MTVLRRRSLAILALFAIGLCSLRHLTYSRIYGAGSAAPGSAFVNVPLVGGTRSNLGEPSARSQRLSNKIVREAALTAVPGLLAKIKLEGRVSPKDPYKCTDSAEALEMIVGDEELLTGLDRHVLGMSVGQTKEIKIPAKEAYGPLLSNMVLDVPGGGFPTDIEPGTVVTAPDGTSRATIVDINDKSITLTFNHPWVGKSLDLRVTLLDCREVSEMERIVVKTNSPGDGKTFPQYGDDVKLHYQKMRPSTGEVLASSRDGGEPLAFTIGAAEVDAGWDGATMKMSLGQCATIKIPSAMTDGMVTDDDTLLYAELLEINGQQLSAEERRSLKPAVAAEGGKKKFWALA